ncbi:hypothetical protein RSOLAG1IB_09355 [Rhizoctonia solani AG-1 IB]|uniref:Uncharacterized protein n=1 Tax=Thanatephorus cucumeris (strain AG1-IB / isolate 7/3/14) TaxID=1108050 RepID=A0A0B7FQ83_THACB|nr:hypothetical protein RSOLAG1IB_09355 [Rhizoctonia solani AG-1 IB]
MVTTYVIPIPSQQFPIMFPMGMGFTNTADDESQIQVDPACQVPGPSARRLVHVQSTRSVSVPESSRSGPPSRPDSRTLGRIPKSCSLRTFGAPGRSLETSLYLGEFGRIRGQVRHISLGQLLCPSCWAF